MTTPEKSQKVRKVLIVTSSGGGGLLQAANAKEQEIRAADPEIAVLQRDVMKDWVWTKFGQFCINQWNQAQLKGDVKRQILFGKTSFLAQYVFWPHIFFYSLYTLFKEDIDRIIDCQIMGTSALIKALRFFNRRRKKQIHLEKVLVDLPTKQATHFFDPIRALGKKDRKLFRLVTIPPMLENGQTEEEFWKENCNLTQEQLQYEEYYVRQSFVKYRNLKRKSETITLKTRYQNLEELEWIQKSIQRSSAEVFFAHGEIHFHVRPEERVFTILLGSQPSNDATLNYVLRCIDTAVELGYEALSTYLFVFCSNHEPEQRSLLRRISEAVQAYSPYPERLTIVPMSFQSDDVIAPLFYRSDMTCTRSGGQTAMELLTVSKGEIWIHSETKGEADNEELLKGIPCWESANAAYLQYLRGAKIVTPETISRLIKPLMTSRQSTEINLQKYN